MRYFYPLRQCLFIWLSLVCSFANGQVPSALGLSPYSGISRIHINPSLGIQSAYKWDATLTGAHIFGQSDYAFIRKANLLNLSSALTDAQVIDAQSEIPEQSDGSTSIIFDEDGGSKMMYLRGSITGPSVTFNLGSSTRVGLFSNLRGHLSSSDIPENFGLYELNQSYVTNIIDIDPGLISYASWMEIGAHISKRIENITFGANIKILRGHEGGYIDSNVDVDYGFVDSIISVAGVLDYDIAFTNSSINTNSLETNFNGGGIGLDFGVSYQTELFQVGASLMDIGVIQYNSNVEIYTSDILSSITDVRTQDFRNFSTLRSFMDQLQNDLSLTPDNFGVFSIGLPTRFTLYGDYPYNENISVSALLNQRLPLFANSLKANNTLVITPRYETDLISVFLPITVYEYQSIRIGTAMRVGPVTIGTDHLSSVFFNSDFTGSDVFFNLTLYPFNQSSTTSSGRGGKGVSCPMF